MATFGEIGKGVGRKGVIDFAAVVEANLFGEAAWPVGHGDAARRIRLGLEKAVALTQVHGLPALSVQAVESGGERLVRHRHQSRTR
jgi:hypothetical protein